MSVWDRLVGQEDVVAELSAAAERGAEVAAARRSGGGSGTRLQHAWLLTGPAGSGRSVAARAFAAALQCSRTGCGECADCVPALAGSHADVHVVVPEGREIVVAEAREMAVTASRSPLVGRWNVLLVEDADRLNEKAANALLKALEEPPPSTVFLLCAPSAEDVLPTIRSRCRVVRLRTPRPDAVAGTLEAEGVAPAEAAWAARAAQGHVGRARRLAVDEEARRRRSEALSLVTSLDTVPSALAAAAALIDAAEAEAEQITAPRDAQEMEALRAALGEGATKGDRTRRLTGVKGEVKDLEKRQANRATRVKLDALDRALTDVAAYYRDVLVLQLSAAVDPVHGDLTGTARRQAARTSPATTMRRLDAVLRCRRLLLETQANARLAVEDLALALQSGDARAAAGAGR